MAQRRAGAAAPRPGYLQQVQEDEGIGGAAALVELRRQHGDVDQQRPNSSRLPSGRARAEGSGRLNTPARRARQHLPAAAAACQRDAPPDRDELADHRDPAQLAQLRQFFGPDPLGAFPAADGAA